MSPDTTTPHPQHTGDNLAKDTAYQHLLGRISEAYATGRRHAYQSVNAHITRTYWQIGRDIVEFEQVGKVRAAYGKALLTNLSRDLSKLYL